MTALIEVTAAAIQGFTESVLASRYDDPKPTPKCHREWWELCCSKHPKVAIAAPRDHAKTTAITGAYAITEIVSRNSRHILYLSANEDLAKAFVNEILIEFNENDNLRELVDFKGFVKEAETEIIGQFKDKAKFRIIAKGAGQRMRGIKWENKRPDLVIADDMEDDEIVLNAARREKFKRWFYGAVIPIISGRGKIRLVGTIVHMDSLLAQLMPNPKDPDSVVEPLKICSKKKNPVWKSVKYRAHDAAKPEDSTFFLWPEKYSKETLIEKRRDFEERGILDVYGQEYLNDPIDESVAYFKEEDFLPLPESESQYTVYAGADFAISQSERADFTALVVIGYTLDGFIDVLHAERGRWDSKEIIDSLIRVNNRYRVDTWFFETEKIDKAIGPFLFDAIRKKPNTRMFIEKFTPSKDKRTRAKPLQGKMRSGSVRFDKEAPWYPDLHEEMRRFDKGVHDDYVDAFSLIGRAIDELIEPPTDQELADEEYDDMAEVIGRSATTGY